MNGLSVRVVLSDSSFEYMNGDGGNGGGAKRTGGRTGQGRTEGHAGHLWPGASLASEGGFQKRSRTQVGRESWKTSFREKTKKTRSEKTYTFFVETSFLPETGFHKSRFYNGAGKPVFPGVFGQRIGRPLLSSLWGLISDFETSLKPFGFGRRRTMLALK